MRGMHKKTGRGKEETKANFPSVFAVPAKPFLHNKEIY
jgi:hypothetical protein